MALESRRYGTGCTCLFQRLSHDWSLPGATTMHQISMNTQEEISACYLVNTDFSILKHSNLVYYNIPIHYITCSSILKSSILPLKSSILLRFNSNYNHYSIPYPVVNTLQVLLGVYQVLFYSNSVQAVSYNRSTVVFPNSHKTHQHWIRRRH